jgi:hypothetical protein
MVRRRLVFLLGASCSLILGVTKFSSFVVGPDMKAKEEWLIYGLRLLRGVNFPVIHGVTYFVTSLCVDKLSLRDVNLPRALFIGTLAAGVSLTYGLSDVSLDRVEAATRFWFKPHVEVLKIFLGIPTKNELVIRVYKHLLLCVGTMTAYTLGCDVRGRALAANQGAHVVHTLTQVLVVRNILGVL